MPSETIWLVGEGEYDDREVLFAVDTRERAIVEVLSLTAGRDYEFKDGRVDCLYWFNISNRSFKADGPTYWALLCELRRGEVEE